MKISLRFNFWALLYIKPVTIFFFLVVAFNCRGVLAPKFESVYNLVKGPKYDGKYLHRILREKLGETRLGKTLTNVVIPTFDIKLLQPTIFSSYEVSLSLSLSLSLSVCVSVSVCVWSDRSQTFRQIRLACVDFGLLFSMLLVVEKDIHA
jgi:hypothetical protein